MIDRIFDVSLFALSAYIAIYLLTVHSAPWAAIAIYWAVNAIKNGRRVNDG